MSDHTHNEHDQHELPTFDHDVREEDNPIPQWWWIFLYSMIATAVFYFGYYHVFSVGPSLQEELQLDVQRAKLEQEVRDREFQAKMELTMAPAEIGKKYFKTFCASCHGTEGEGNIGPNFHDNSWIHVPTTDTLNFIVNYGVSNKGMPAWGPMLGDKKVKALVAYVQTLKDQPLNIPGKVAEGKQYSKEEVTSLMTGQPLAATVAAASTEKKAEPVATKPAKKAKVSKKAAAPKNKN